jgi:hypothetical protein
MPVCGNVPQKTGVAAYVVLAPLGFGSTRRASPHSCCAFAIRLSRSSIAAIGSFSTSICGSNAGSMMPIGVSQPEHWTIVSFLLSPIGVNNASSNLLTARAPACPCNPEITGGRRAIGASRAGASIAEF